MKIDKSYSVSLIVAISFFMQGLDTTAVNTAIPTMAKSFGTDVVHLSAGVTSYLIALAIFIPVSGWIADRYGTRKVFCTSIILFILASALCGFSQTLTQFVAFRIFQGMAGAMMTPVGRLAVLKTTPKEKLVTAMAYITWPALVAPILGPLVGGYLTTYWHWHWIFFLNVPISIICVLLAWYHIPEEKGNNPIKPRFDFVGFVLSGLALAGFMYGVELFSRAEVAYYIPVITILISIGLLFFNIRYSRHISNPLIDYSVIRIPTYKITIFTGSISRMVIGVAPYLVPLMFQEGFGLSPFQSGTLFLATMAGNLAMKPATIWIMRHYNFRTVLISNGLLVALFTFFTALLLPTTPVILIVIVMFLSGMFRSMQFSAITTLAFADIPQPRMTSANTLYSTVQQMSTGMGIAMGAVFLRFSNMINGSSDHYSVADFRLAFIFVAMLGIISLYGYTKLTPDAGDVVRIKKR
ncbi:DHA2 family efflux MFS transporter permease subunit [Dysgonomonas sp. Marseille-P4677]|uniref:DHA2 family efflux MFS transporter permease subunit n=1 Tax=Dysgonomonas sp. Marseille-P4677 TaxID=2364790 RepID=UPI0019114A9A|nr:DHA2 family efflux MFS transporter permease subunit [Dysgonomonas sp. Marseille-P4677]MBK5722888.1 DHA2 family efflux MFS transporter permease subunit [Dysgonomonas sp. Marseille-P4677]